MKRCEPSLAVLIFPDEWQFYEERKLERMYEESEMTKLEKANACQGKNRIEKDEKPVFHVTPPTGWMNDPNGFSIYQGKIHLFYQYNPYQAEWGTIHWGHCISEDFVKWQELPVALAPDKDYDAGGCFSGSAMETKEGHVLVYTGVMEQEAEDGSKTAIQHQCLAVGDGTSYKKSGHNPVIPGELLVEGCAKEDFRDPKIWEEDGNYYLVAVNKNVNGNGQVLLFESQDLRTWEYLSVLADNRGRYGKMWECPDFFAIGDKHVLVVSPQDMQEDGNEFHNGNQAAALIGEYDRQNHCLLEEQVVSLDYGTDFYAPQTLQAEDGRRIMIAWMHSWDMDIKPAGQKWDGMMTLPRQLEIRKGILYQNPVRELERYRTEPVIHKEKEISGTCMIPGICGRVLDLELELLEGDYETFTIHFARNHRYSTCFRYVRAMGTIEFDRRHSGIIRDVVCQRAMKIKGNEKTLKLRLVLDRFSAELFVNNGAQAFTSIFYTPVEAGEIVFECEGTARVNIEKYKITPD